MEVDQDHHPVLFYSDYFNSLPRGEVDSSAGDGQYEITAFQLTTSHRGRLASSAPPLPSAAFHLTTSHRGRQ